MPYENVWLREPVIRHHRYYGKVTSEEYETALQEELARLKTVEHKQFYIVNFKDVTSFPINPMQIPATLEYIRHPHFGAIAFIGFDSIANFWVNVASRIVNHKIVRAT